MAQKDKWVRIQNLEECNGMCVFELDAINKHEMLKVYRKHQINSEETDWLFLSQTFMEEESFDWGKLSPVDTWEWGKIIPDN